METTDEIKFSEGDQGIDNSGYLVVLDITQSCPSWVVVETGAEDLSPPDRALLGTKPSDSSSLHPFLDCSEP